MTIDQLAEYGLEQMADEEIRAFLADHSTGVLGLPTADIPYLVPLSYGFDDGAALYFTYLLGESSRKADLTEQAGRGRFLVYDIETAFEWQSVMLDGDISRVPEAEWDDITALTQNAWRPNTLQTATTSGGVALYEFEITDLAGIRQTGLAPGFRENIEP
ncbi:pyridoxamine 5'-phosphate oxidase family protein [Haloarcula brevis]|uniref:pyridoxamine 5'-phosphate oxidase family protein n=1 Tax=Haloarcula brevis TaxID=3111453 RepID=UPI00300F6B75